MSEIKKVVLAYSGGLDTSVIIPWLKENYNCEVIAMCADVGQGDELAPVHDKALKSGASKVYIEDLKQEFVESYVWPTLKAGAVYEGKYLLGTSFARPIIAKALVAIAEKEGADAIAHGATGKGNDQVRFELTVKALAPHLKIIAPWRLWDIRSREDAFDYAEKHNIPIPVAKSRPYSMDRNIWHLSHEGADLENPANEPMDDVYLVSKSPENAPDKAVYVDICFEKGIPVAVDGEKLGAVALLEKLNILGAEHGIGITDIVENRLVGMKSRGVYENPGGSILYYAHRELEYLTLDRATMHYKEQVAIRYAELVYDGMWFSPLKEALDAFVDSTQQTVTGTVRLKLYKGNIMSAGSKSPYSLYHEGFVTFGRDEVYNQKDAEGFINLFGLPLKVRALMLKEAEKK
ncbi:MULTISPECIES: argininosuccinate synthase [Pelosinus]|uniref:Argininosuccinate synthase n=1 Tax=Pelosinus fermentans B4 TaxID=1149862 RepID=I8RBR9_9FIRM|nr:MULTISPECIES: argininosuccinate synthase [Pelosinus]EIW16498.1 argininosuccinate synthase [Pelosinus fermentans B4]EIW22521.1 Argininosuccinate synthase [Pelosinus fermentans A11]OAM95805.1 Argininosuccinate synthase [Pelosinus fermentans DSM 17108]SDR32999.1 argininosuccinate synthase [Pelosinus fermentans]